ncbi:MAG: SDR family NAD(P)-dependent oxidoreductase, partial [Planctomycetota bacterium]
AGGTAGFGLVLAHHLAAAGARVLIVGRSAERVQAAVATLLGSAQASDAPSVHAAAGMAADLEQPGEGRRVVAEAEQMWGGVDDLFFCIGRSGRARLLDTPADGLRASLEANLLCAVEITQAAAAGVAAAGGQIVYIGSLAGKLVTPFMGPYAVAKSALAAYADGVRLELAPRGGHVLLVSPGPIGRKAGRRQTEPAVDRYAAAVAQAGLPPEALSPGGTKALKALDPDRLAARVLVACQRRQPELVVPAMAGWLAGLIECCPRWGRLLLGRVSSSHR